MKNPYKLPRKKKKEFKKRDPELYRMTYLLSRAGIAAKNVARRLGGLAISIDSFGGTIANGSELHKRLYPQL